MSGGRWAYEDRKLSHLAEMLRKEDESALTALGDLLEDVMDPLHEIDRVYSGDANPERLRPALDRLEELISKASGAVSVDRQREADVVAAIREAVMGQVDSYRQYERSVTMQGGDGMVTAGSVADDLEQNLLKGVIEAACKDAAGNTPSDGIDVDRIIAEAVRLARMPSYRPDEIWLWHKDEVVAEVRRLCLPPDHK